MSKANIIQCETPMRRKYWHEMDDHEKIDLLMDELIKTQRTLSKLGDYLNQLINHDHRDGKMIAPIERPGQESYGGFYFHVYEKKHD